VVLPASLGYLAAGDIIAVNRKSGRTRVLFRRASMHNSLLVTERCDNFCVMCSQPPRNVRDDSLIDEILALIPRLPSDLHELGFTGGEPTLAGERLLEVLHQCKERLPTSAIHVLTNGRRFADRSFAESWAAIGHPDLMAGIPVYADQSYVHDFIVQADGAFDETIRGILNLKSLRQKVEIRIVLHRHTIRRLDRFAEFVARNLCFVDHVALMGLELMGFAIANQDDLWIKVADYAGLIADAAELLTRAGLRTSIYNIPLCLLKPRARPFAIASISDWKREYWPACDGCMLQPDCGGAFFSSMARMTAEIMPVYADIGAPLDGRRGSNRLSPSSPC
jgi:His-Xaa-Ser system radical SAM maturase HxsC